MIRKRRRRRRRLAHSVWDADVEDADVEDTLLYTKDVHGRLLRYSSHGEPFVMRRVFF